MTLDLQILPALPWHAPVLIQLPLRLSLMIFVIKYLLIYKSRASLIAQSVKNKPTMQETPVQFLGQEDPLEKG